MAKRTDAVSEKQIQAEIERTRAEMSGTVRELEERLAPGRIKEQVLEQLHDAKERVKDEVTHDVTELRQKLEEEVHHVREVVTDEIQHVRSSVQDGIQTVGTTVRDATIGRVEHMVSDARHTIEDTSSSLVETIKENPIPSAMIALGIGWLLMSGSGRRGASYRTTRLGQSRFAPRHMMHEGERAVGRAVEGAQIGVRSVGERIHGSTHHMVERGGEILHGIEEQVGSIAGDVRDRAGHMVHDAGEFAGNVYHRAEFGVRRAERGFDSVMRENPLAVGAVALAVGAAVGLALPSTHIEDEYLGGPRDRLMETARHEAEVLAQQAIGKVEEVSETITPATASGSDGSTQKREPKNGLSHKPQSQLG